MNCSKCGNVLNPTETFCPKCGQPVNVQNTETTNQTIGTPQPAPQQAPQPAMNNPYNQGQQPKKNTGFIIIIVILILAIIGVVLYFVLGNKDNTTGDTNTTVDNGTGDNNTQPTTVDNGGNTNTYTYKNYEFQTPAGYEHMEHEGGLYYVDRNNKVVVAIISILPYSYQELLDSKDELKNSSNDSYTIENIVEETHGGTEWLKVVTTSNGKTINQYFTKLDDYNIVQLLYLNEGNTKTEEQILSDFVSVFANAKYVGSSGFNKNDSDDKKIEIELYDKDLSSMLK